MTVDELKRNVDCVTERVRKAEAAAGHKVTVVAATKTVSKELINAALEMGITDIGENRVQEYLAKRDAVFPPHWHFIGTLQRNKAKYLVGNVALIHSVGSIVLAREIDRLAKNRGVKQSVLIEVNAEDEASKTGAPIEKAQELIVSARELTGITVRGIMAVPPVSATDSVYERLYRLYDGFQGGEFDTLSVGMSGDYEKAIGFGSNMVRIGTAIFGARNYER